MWCRHATQAMRELVISMECYVDGEARRYRNPVFGGRTEAPLLHSSDETSRIAGQRARDVDVLHAPVGADGEEEAGRGVTPDMNRRHRLIDGYRLRAGQICRPGRQGPRARGLGAPPPPPPLSGPAVRPPPGVV